MSSISKERTIFSKKGLMQSFKKVVVEDRSMEVCKKVLKEEWNNE